MITKQSFNFSDSLVIKELERIGRERKLVTDDEPELYVPVIEKKASNRLNKSGNLIADIMVLADELDKRGYVKQADSLVKKALILKRAMSDAGAETLYGFWKETGEGLVDHAQRNSDGGAEGYKVKNVNEVHSAIVGTLGSAPTGSNERSLKIAKMVEMIVKKGQVAFGYLLKYRALYDNTYSKQNISKYIDTLKNLGYIGEDLQYTGKTIQYGSYNDTIKDLEALQFVGGGTVEKLNEIKYFGVFYDLIMNQKLGEAKGYFGDFDSGGVRYPAFMDLFQFTARSPGYLHTDDWDDAQIDTVVSSQDMAKAKPELNEYDVTGLSGSGVAKRNEWITFFSAANFEKIISDFVAKYTNSAADFNTRIINMIKFVRRIAQAKQQMDRIKEEYKTNPKIIAVVDANLKLLGPMIKSWTSVTEFEEALDVNNITIGDLDALLESLKGY